MMKTHENTPHRLSVPAVSLSRQPQKHHPSHSDHPNEITRQDILFGGAAFVLHNFLTREECNDFIQQAETLGLEDCGYSKRIRRTDRVAAESKEVAELLFDRAAPFLGSPIDLSQRKSPAHYPEGIPTTIPPYEWVPSGINPTIRICRYKPGGFFLPHHDGGFYRDQFNQSIKTFMVYLNDDYEGGHTHFFNELQRHYVKPNPDHVIYAYEPQAGDALIFNSAITHHGGKLARGNKYILRSEIMYQARVQKRELEVAKPDYDPDIEFTWP